MKDKCDKLLKAWRLSGESHFGIWLEEQQNKCEFCEVNCGNIWCHVNNDNKESKDDEEN